MASVFESRGYFWRGSESLDGDVKIPQTAVTGELAINEDGSSHLTLDALLSEGLPNAFKQMDPFGPIAGLLYGDGGYVYLLDNYVSNIHFSFNGPGREEFDSSYCLRGDFPMLDPSGVPTADGFSVSLEGLQEWMLSPRINVCIPGQAKEGVASQTFSFRTERIAYSIKNATLSVNFGINRDFSHALLLGMREVAFAQTVNLEYCSRSALNIRNICDLVNRIQEFIAILTGFFVDLPWPQVLVGTDRPRENGVLYFRRMRPSGKSPTLTDLWTTFPGIQENLAVLFESFLSSREKYGPGVYLYLACLRSRSMFAENRFTTLISGLESLYRRDESLPQESSTELERIERILRDVQQKSDRAWLRKKLEYRAEISLQDRLFRLFEPMKSYVDGERLRAFFEECATLRNDIAHFGGLRGTTTYPELLERLGMLTPALSTLYQAFLLLRIGVNPEIVSRAFKSSPVAWAVKDKLVQAGLLDAEAPPTLQLHSSGST